MKRIISLSAVFAVLFFAVSCGSKENVSPFGDVLSHPPFSALTDSISRDRKNDGLYFRRAVLLNTNNFPEPALADFRSAWSLRKDERYALGIAGLLLEKKPDSAAVFISDALHFLPASLLLRLDLAHAYDGMNQPVQAIAVCDSILSRNPQQVDVLKLKADLLDRQGQKKESTAVLESAYRITPYDVELNYMLALQYAEGKDPKVISLCDSLIRADSAEAHAEPYYYKGIFYSNTNQRPAALAQFDLALAKDYNFLDAYIEKTSLLYDMKRFQEGAKTASLALTISPQFADAYYWLGRCEEALHNTDDAKINYEKALGLDHNLVQAKEGLDRLAGHP